MPGLQATANTPDSSLRWEDWIAFGGSSWAGPAKMNIDLGPIKGRVGAEVSASPGVVTGERVLLPRVRR